MYNAFFGFREPPFSIAPDPRYLYLSERHKEALAHLMYGVQGQGGFIVITGEVGTGKTTVCRCFLDSIPEHVDVALILNPRLSARELLGTICDELGLRYPAGASIKRLIDQLNRHLLDAHALGRHTVLIIDEAQNLSTEVLEQLRLLTNLETREKKLLQIVLLGQPELQDILAQAELRQLSQRVTARYHLDSLSADELEAYVRYRLSVAGQKQQLFDRGALKSLYRLSHGIPRLINLISDRALLGAYAQGTSVVDKRLIKQAAREVLGDHVTVSHEKPANPLWKNTLAGMLGGLATAAVVVGLWSYLSVPAAAVPEQTVQVKASESEKAVEVAASKTAEEQPKAEETIGSTQSEPDIRDDSAGRDRLLAQFKPAKDNSYQAYRALFAAWGIDFHKGDNRYACDHAETRGLRCLHRQGNWRSLLQLDRPAILRLFNNQGEEYFVTLVSVDGQTVTLNIDGQDYQRSLQEVDQHWLGDYSLFWQVPAYDSSLIKPGDVTDKALWLQQTLARLRNHYDVENPEAEDWASRPVEEQIRWYQHQVGLVPDGILGTMTLIRINSDLDSGVPRLKSSRHPSIAVSES
ncbi:AAA family ATPase [Marinobacteraceae bacterium S3BR75-40.1]